MLEPEVFYLLLSAEGVSIPPGYAAEMLAYDPTAGELRTHYAGFFDPGFGYSAGPAHGSRAALEVRARDVSFMVEHRQPVCKLAFERMAEEPDVLYGKDIGSNYQGQLTMLSKHFAEQRPPVADRAPPLLLARRAGDAEVDGHGPRFGDFPAFGERHLRCARESRPWGRSSAPCRSTRACRSPAVRRADPEFDRFHRRVRGAGDRFDERHLSDELRAEPARSGPRVT